MKKILALFIVFLMVFSMFSVLAPGVKAKDEIKRLITKFEQTLSELENLANAFDEAVIVDYLDQSLQQLKLDVEELDLDPETKDSLLDKLNAAIGKIGEARVFVLDGKEKQTNNMINAIGNILEAFIHEIEALRGVKIPEEDADNLNWQTQQILETSKKRGQEIIEIIDEVEIKLSKEVLEKFDVKIEMIREIVTQLQTLGVQVDVVLVEESPWIPYIVLLGTYTAVNAIVSAYFTYNSVIEKLEAEGRSISPQSKAKLFLASSVIWATIYAIAFPAGGPAAVMFTMWALGLAPIWAWLIAEFLETLIVGDVQRELVEYIVYPIFAPLIVYAGGANPGIVYMYIGGTEWGVISPELGYAVLSIVKYKDKLYVGTMSTSDPRNGVGRVYRYDGIDEAGEHVWTLVGDGMDDQVCSLAVYQGDLYAGTAWGMMRLYRYNDAPGDWTMVVDYPWGWNKVSTRFPWLSPPGRHWMGPHGSLGRVNFHPGSTLGDGILYLRL